MENLPHPAAIAPCQIFVDGDKMCAFAAEGVEIQGQSGDKGLAFTSPHFDDIAAVEQYAADDLYIVMAHSRRAAGCFAYQCVCFWGDIFEGFTIGYSLFENGRFSP